MLAKFFQNETRPKFWDVQSEVATLVDRLPNYTLIGIKKCVRGGDALSVLQ
jgi:hypothetical protein